MCVRAHACVLVGTARGHSSFPSETSCPELQERGPAGSPSLAVPKGPPQGPVHCLGQLTVRQPGKGRGCCQVHPRQNPGVEFPALPGSQAPERPVRMRAPGRAPIPPL